MTGLVSDSWCLSFCVLLYVTSCHLTLGGDEYHKKTRADDYMRGVRSPVNEEEIDSSFWINKAQESIGNRLKGYENRNKAKNVVMFLGDGMSVPTLTAARTLLGQRQGKTGEESQLAFENFPVVGLAKTYCVDSQISDSACTANAYLCGVKANKGTIGVNPSVLRYNCTAAADEFYHVHSIATWALEAGKDAGIVTSTRITHASPAGVYAHTANRDWESDADVEAECDPAIQADIAYQLVHSYPGNKLKVILGGGRREFIPKTINDEEGTQGKRLDERNLIEEWKAHKQYEGVTHQYVWNRDQLKEVVDSSPEYLLGLFEGSHMQYNMQANESTEPTLTELTEAAIRLLSRNDNGFFLFVEGGRIDHAHHDNLVHLALDETIEMAKAVEKAAELLSEDDSLIVVTSDHAHVMTLNGYTHRGNDILGPSDDKGDDGVPYMTLSYSNGPGFRPHVKKGVRDNVLNYDYRDLEFPYPAEVPLDLETHGGDDVAVFARGPFQHLFTGVYEQHYIPHYMAFAACIGEGKQACDLVPLNEE